MRETYARYVISGSVTAVYKSIVSCVPPIYQINSENSHKLQTKSSININLRKQLNYSIMRFTNADQYIESSLRIKLQIINY